MTYQLTIWKLNFRPNERSVCFQLLLWICLFYVNCGKVFELRGICRTVLHPFEPSSESARRIVIVIKFLSTGNRAYLKRSTAGLSGGPDQQRGYSRSSFIPADKSKSGELWGSASGSCQAHHPVFISHDHPQITQRSPWITVTRREVCKKINGESASEAITGLDPKREQDVRQNNSFNIREELSTPPTSIWSFEL